MSIIVDHVTKVYGVQQALDDVLFKVNKGEVVGFLGPNGAGKSTMMKIISCFIPPTSGRVEVCGNEIADRSMEVRRLVGYLPESNPLYQDMYVKEYLSFVSGIYGLKNEVARIKEMIEMTGLEVEQHKRIGQLSKGYKQRVGLAQALIHDPEVLILDEPTSGLDPNQLVGIRSLIKELGRTKTVLFSSHIMQEVEAVCDRVIIIDKGRIVADQKVSDLAQNGLAHILVVEFDRSVDVNSLKTVKGVSDVRSLEDNKYAVVHSEKVDLRVPVSKWAQENSILIIGMNREEQRLEDVFQQLTAKR